MDQSQAAGTAADARNPYAMPRASLAAPLAVDVVAMRFVRPDASCIRGDERCLHDPIVDTVVVHT